MDAATTWKKREVMRLDCPSGSVCHVRRPSPEVSLKCGRVANVFAPKEGIDVEDLSDEQAAKVYVFARQLVLAAVITPKLSDKDAPDALTPEDIPPADFWHIFKWAMRGGPGLPVALEEGEATVESVETFPVESGTLPVSSGSGEQVSQASV